MNGFNNVVFSKGQLSAVGSLSGTISIPYGGLDYYNGEYKVTPNDKVQTLDTANKIMKKNIVVEASTSGLPGGYEMASDEDIDNLTDEIFGKESESEV